MHGRHDFRLTDAERDAAPRVPRTRRHAAGRLDLRQQAVRRPRFRRELAAALPGHPIERIPADDPLFTTAFGGYDIRQVSLRDPQVADERPAGRRPRPPGRAAARRHPARRPLGRHLLAVRHQLRTRKPRSHRLPRLHPTRRRPHRPQRAAVFAESIKRCQEPFY